MPIELEQIVISGHPDKIKPFQVTENSWRLYKCISTTNPKVNLHDDIRNLQPEDRKKAKILFTNLGSKCESGQPLTEMYDTKQLHGAEDFSYQSKSGETVNDTVWRIRSGALRLYFIYLSGGRRIAVLHLWYKRAQKLSKSEKTHLTTLATAILLQLEVENEK